MAMEIDALRIRALQRLILGTALLLMGLLIVPAAQAQGPGRMNASPEERANARIAMLTQRIQLTAPQSAQLKPILVKQFTEMSAMMQSVAGGGDRAAMRAQMQALRSKYDPQILAVLTDAQKKLYQVMAEEEAARRVNRGAGGAQ